MATSIIPRASNDDHDLGEVVELTANQDYTAPSDGYVVVIGPNASTTSYTRCQINGINVITVAYSNISGVSEQSCCYVKKNMVIKAVSLPSSSGGKIRYYPIE